ncbi:NAD(P)-dependent oxidoreductase [Litorimonas haliclonae]|uniref:NAD(P)-dependent oxidoreductase n=1 Tax=Litorimonas haliclonae TaxID=2081977 RepID=UPI0039EF3C06
MANCAFIGLGVMGFPMAGHLVSAGHKVRVWNRTKARAEDWAKSYEGTACRTIDGCVEEADFIFICVGQDKDVYSVMTPILESASDDAIIVDHTTASSKCALKCYQNAQREGLTFIDAPISGGESGAVNGQLSVMCGGEKEAFEKVRPVMEAYAKAITLIGGAGAGQTAKMINQICIAGILQGLSEGVHFAEKMGLDMKVVLDAIGKGAAQSWQMDNRALTMAAGEFDFGFAIDWMRKDLGIVLDTAKDRNITLPLVEEVQERYETVQKIGGGRWDTSALIKALE